MSRVVQVSAALAEVQREIYDLEVLREIQGAAPSASVDGDGESFAERRDALLAREGDLVRRYPTECKAIRRRARSVRLGGL
jgi:hypothetical protein